jgi:transcriptional regulator with XRE-family HTH domain
MLEEAEIDRKKAELKQFLQRGRITDAVIADNRESISEIFAPLPPPWDWQIWRELAGMTAAGMAQLSGVQAGRIRQWENGAGSLDVEEWLGYGNLLVETVAKALGESDPVELTAVVTRRMQVASQNQSIIAIERQQRTTISSMESWIAQMGDKCSPDEAFQLMKVSKEAIVELRRLQSRLRAIRETRKGGTEG